MKALEKIRIISETLSRHGIESPDKEAQIIIEHSLAVDLVDIYRDNPSIPYEKDAEVERIVARRLRREPLQYILGYVDFLGVKIAVGREVLIPRPETEMMVEDAINALSAQLSAVRNGHGITILDLCTGSGCIALALARQFPAARIYGIDISEAAIAYAGKNALANNVENAVFLCGNLFDCLKSDQRFDLIIANPPYVLSADIQTLQPEVREWEPRAALDGGPDGLDAYREIIPHARNFLKNNGILILELGTGLAQSVSGIARQAGFSGITAMKDLAGIERILRAEWIN